MIFTNKHNLPKPLFNALTADDYDRVGDISVTELIKSPRQRLLAKRHWDDVVVDASSRLWMLMGKMVHKIIEEGSKGLVGVAEKRRLLKIPLQGGRAIELSLKPDWIYPVRNKIVLSDWKCSAVYGFILAKDNGYVRKEWEQQLNAYRWAYHKLGVKIHKLELGGMVRDWKKRAFLRAFNGGDNDYPSAPVQPYAVKVWHIKRAEKYVLERIKTHLSAESLPDNELPLCTAEERWERAEKWAIMMSGKKRATKLFDTEEEANVFLDDTWEDEGARVEHRPGECMRCDPDICYGAPWCSQNVAMHA